MNIRNMLLLLCSLIAVPVQGQNIEQLARFTPRVINPLPSATNLPKAYDWRDINGVNMVTISRNQHIPQYCGSCWAFSATSVMSDRLQIQRKGQWPQINLAPQFILDCGQHAGTCHGGNFMNVFEYVSENGMYG